MPQRNSADAVVDHCAAGARGDGIGQISADVQGCGGRRHAHPVDGQTLEDLAGGPAGVLLASIGAVQWGLLDLPVTPVIRAVEFGMRTRRLAA